MDDLIDGQVAIDAIQAHKHNVLDAREYDEGVACGYAAAHNHICDVIAILPSAQPEREKGKRIRNMPPVQPEKEIPKRVLWSGWKGMRDTRYKCPNCKKPVRNTDIYCHRCGQKLMFPNISFTPYVEGQKQELIVKWDDEGVKK